MYTVEQMRKAGKDVMLESEVEDIIEKMIELYGLGNSQNCGKPIVSLSLPPSEAAIKDALLIGYVAGHSTQADIEENVLWEKYKKYCLKSNKVPDDGGGNKS